MPVPKMPCYTLWLGGGTEERMHQYFEDLSWGWGMMQKLEAAARCAVRRFRRGHGQAAGPPVRLPRRLGGEQSSGEVMQFLSGP